MSDDDDSSEASSVASTESSESSGTLELSADDVKRQQMKKAALKNSKMMDRFRGKNKNLMLA